MNNSDLVKAPVQGFDDTVLVQSTSDPACLFSNYVAKMSGEKFAENSSPCSSDPSCKSVV